MPKQVDRDQRRRQIIDALWRIAAKHGLHAVSFREVAAEAGTSVRLVQYYFGTKQQLLLSSFDALNLAVWQRASKRLPSQDATPRARVAGILTELIPADEKRRTTMLLYKMYETAALTNSDLADSDAGRHGAALERYLADTLRDAQHSGDLLCDVDGRVEAAELVALAAGLGSTVLARQHTPALAARVIVQHLNRLFGPEP
jgi:AcrR family transcriptional regulator